jgi:hypothetical protein
MTTYQELQKKGVEAFHSYYGQQERAAGIMDSISQMCIDVLGFPTDNIGFRSAEEPDDDRKPQRSAARVLQRDERGRWRARMSLRVDADTTAGEEPIVLGRGGGGGGNLWTYVLLEIFFRGDVAELSLPGDQSLTVEFSHVQDANKAKYDAILQRVVERVQSTSDWFGRGVGEKPPIGFGGANFEQ